MARTYKFRLQGNTYEIKVLRRDEDGARVSVNGSEFNVEFLPEEAAPSKTPRLERTRVIPDTVAKTTITEKPGAEIGVGMIKAPLPGNIFKLLVQVGDKVQAGQNVLIMEAMKMENEIHAPTGGVVKEVRVREGQTVLEGEVLLVVQAG
ncbi:MAG: biotin/lipoyl-containing protein [bacterium]|jgi:biotin carboxyl carrier protein|nr:biotin/lipoyl-containing protein [bacterium]